MSGQRVDGLLGSQDLGKSRKLLRVMRIRWGPGGTAETEWTKKGTKDADQVVQRTRQDDGGKVSAVFLQSTFPHPNGETQRRR